MLHTDESMAILEFAGHSIAKQRKVAGLTQSQLAERSKVSRATIASIENGAADPKLSTIIAICAGISPSAWTLLLQEMWMSRIQQMSSPATSSTKKEVGFDESAQAEGKVSLPGLALTSASLAALGPGAIAAGAVGGPVGAAIGGLLGMLLTLQGHEQK